MERPSFKRKTDMEDSGPRKNAKVASSQGVGGKMSFAQRMMAKMGHKEGDGLGASGDGMVAPIEVKLRPQGAGLGAVREKTEQAKAEAKRQAERRGEVVENDSSEEEREYRKKRKEAARAGRQNGITTPGGFTRPKVKYRTAADIEAATNGLEVPNVLKSIIDATGKEAKLLTSTAGLMSSTIGITPAEAEVEKIARRARMDLESFADSWTELTERSKYSSIEEEQIQRQIDAEEKEMQRMRQVYDAAVALYELDLSKPSLADEAAVRWEQVTAELERLQIEYGNEIDDLRLSELAVAAIHPLFKQEMIDWEPLEYPLHLLRFLRRLKPILGIKKDAVVPINSYGDFDIGQRSKSTTPYESLIYTLWLPKVRTTITNKWDPHSPSTLITLVEAWRDVLPAFVYHSLTNDLVVQKLSAAVHEWNPRSAMKRKQSRPLPHLWLFPWLPFLDSHHTDPKAATGLLSEVKRKFRSALDTWDLTRRVMPGLEAWRKVLGPSLHETLIRHLLPRFAQHLSSNFEVYPPDQDLTALEDVLAWTAFFNPPVLGQLLISEFFPKWLNTLHAWLTNEPNYDEIRTWYGWWKEQIPSPISEVKAVSEQWTKGLQMMMTAMDLGSLAKHELPFPSAGPPRPLPLSHTHTHTHTQFASPKIESSSPAAATTPHSKHPTDEIPTFRDVVEAWCEEEELLLVPLKKAHDITGLPLFRITAGSRGGVVVYLKGDVVWARTQSNNHNKNKNGADGAAGGWEPVGLEDGLVKRVKG